MDPHIDLLSLFGPAYVIVADAEGRIEILNADGSSVELDEPAHEEHRD